MTFKYISAKETYKSLYYQLPKVLFTSTQYINMSNDTKIAYAMLQDRCEYSINNNWIDSNGYVYFIFTTSDLMELLHCGNKKIAKIKKELREFNLLKEKRIPPKRLEDGSFKTFPPQLYLGQLEVTAQDVYIDTKAVTTNPSSENVERTFSVKPSNIKTNTESVEKTFSEKTARNKPFSESVEKTPNLKESLDTLLDTNIDTEKAQIQQMELLRHFAKTHEQETCLDTRNLDLIALFSNTVKEAEQTIGIILRAKNQIQKNYSCFIIAEDWQDEIESTLRRVFHKLKTDEKIKNQANYMFGAFKVTFDNIARDMKSKDTLNNKTDVPMHNWLETKE